MAKKSHKEAPRSDSKALTSFFGKSLPANPAQTAKALAALASQRKNRLNKPLIRFVKSGDWVFGAENEDLPEGTELAVNPNSFKVGYIAWHKSEIEGERMVSLGQEISEDDLPEVKAKDGWQLQVSVELADPKAAKDGSRNEYIFKTSSMGGRDCLLDLTKKLAEELEENKDMIPVVRLGSTSYKHKDYGRVYKPTLELVRWIKP